MEIIIGYCNYRGKNCDFKYYGKDFFKDLLRVIFGVKIELL